MSRLGLFGGSFDPIHRGHVETLQEALSTHELDWIGVLPTAQRPHKPAARVSAWQRSAMVEMALLEQPRLRVLDWELEVEGPTYTVETLERARTTWPEAELFWILGTDALADLPTYRRWDELIELAGLLVLERPGNEMDRVLRDAPEAMRRAAEAGRVRRTRNRRWEISSTAIRRTLAESGPSGLEAELPPAVLTFIEKYGLYQ